MPLRSKPLPTPEEIDAEYESRIKTAELRSKMNQRKPVSKLKKANDSGFGDAAKSWLRGVR